MADILLKFLTPENKKRVNRLNLISKAIAQHAKDLVDFGGGKSYSGINDLITLVKEADKLRGAIKSDLLFARSFADFAKWIKKEPWHTNIKADDRTVVIQDIQSEQELEDMMQEFQSTLKYTAVADWQWEPKRKTGYVTFG